MTTIIPTISEYRIRKFDEHLNVFNEPTNNRFYFVCDDHVLSRDHFRNIFKSLKNEDKFSLHFASDVIQECAPLFKDCRFYHDILIKYPLSIKLLLFIWLKHTKKINKAFLLDDDTLFLKPIDDFFKSCNYAYKKDTLTSLCTKSHEAMKSQFANIDEYQTINRSHKINSGSIIYTYDDTILPHIQKFFNSEEIHKFICVKDYLIKNKNKVWGQAWLMEQTCYGLLLHPFIKSGECKSFEHLVNIAFTAFNKTEPKPLKRVNHIMHFTAKEKLPLYEYYLDRLNETINQINK